MALSEVDGGSVDAFSINCDVESREVQGRDGIADTIQFYHMRLNVGDPGSVSDLVSRTYANRPDLDDAEEGIRYRVTYDGEAECVEDALKKFQYHIWHTMHKALFPTK